jgi:hypothetical protein
MVMEAEAARTPERRHEHESTDSEVEAWQSMPPEPG